MSTTRPTLTASSRTANARVRVTPRLRHVSWLAGVVLLHSSLSWSQALPVASPESVGMSSPRLEKISQAMQAEIDSQRLPGAVVMVARQGRIGLFEAVGQQDPATAAPMRTDSIFRIYSMTKPLVSVAVMMLVERGRLLISDPVGQWLPEYAQQTVLGASGLVPAWQPATVQDLLRHTAGLTYEFLGDSPVQREYDKVQDRKSVV